MKQAAVIAARTPRQSMLQITDCSHQTMLVYNISSLKCGSVSFVFIEYAVRGISPLISVI